jgi:histidine triad (HIT) family protein
MKKLLYSIAKTSLGGSLVGWAIRNMPFVIPADRLYETDTLLAFNHPAPSYSTHILIVPKKNYSSLLDLDPGDAAFLKDLIECTQDLVRELKLETEGYRLIVNGGSVQDVMHLHFHLVSG